MADGIHINAAWYPGLKAASSFEDFQKLFYDRKINNGVCPTLPCQADKTCHTSQPGDDCYPHITWAMNSGIHSNPEWYAGLTPASSLEDFQTLLHKTRPECPLPCVTGPMPTPEPTPEPTPTPSPVTVPGVMSIRFVNALPHSSVCLHGGNSIRIFGPPGTHNIVAQSELTLIHDWSAGCGVGIQINNWYWTLSQPMNADVQDVDARGMQNPDNSGVNFQIDSKCQISGWTNPCYGYGIRSDWVSDISSAMEGNQCTITVRDNARTDAVTFDGEAACCAPLWAGLGACKSTNGFKTALSRAEGGLGIGEDSKVAWPDWMMKLAKPI